MSKGIIMDIQDKTLIVLTKDGQFMTTHKKNDIHYQLGEEIVIDDIGKKVKSKRFIFSPPSRAWIASAAVMVLLLASFLFNFGISEQKVYAYVTVDINPSFELILDDNLHIMEIVPLNADAKQVLAEVTEWRDQPFSDVTASLVQESKDEGFLTPEQTVILSTVLVEEKEEDELEEKIEDVQNQIEKENVKVKWFEGTEDDRKEAKNAGISTGKLIETKQENKNTEANQNKENQNPNKQNRFDDGKPGQSFNDEIDSPPGKVKNESQKNEKGPNHKNKNTRNDSEEKEEKDLTSESHPADKKNKNNGSQNGNRTTSENGGNSMDSRNSENDAKGNKVKGNNGNNSEKKDK